MIVKPSSRAELINWVNQLTKPDIQKLQQLSDGVHFCQIFNKIYPKTINLNKLKRDARAPMEKEKNFRILLNAINQLKLNMAMNIMDLSQGKITSILELLQWIHKEFQNPKKDSKKNQNKVSHFIGSSVIKTYDGNLYTRQKSCHKGSEKSQNSENIIKSGKSIDLHNLGKQNSKKSLKLSQKSSQSISLYQAPITKIKSQVKSVNFKIISQKKDILDSPKQSLKQKKFQRENQSLEEVLRQALNLNRSRLKKTLIKVTETVAEGNPELQKKLKKILQSEIQMSDDKIQDKNLSPDTQVRNILSSYAGTSELCEKESLCSISQDQIRIFSKERTGKNEIQGALQRENNLMTSNTIKKNAENRKQTVKKSSIKSGKDKSVASGVLSSHIIKQISAQKQRKHRTAQEEIHQWDNTQQISFSKLLKIQNISENPSILKNTKNEKTESNANGITNHITTNDQRKKQNSKSKSSNIFDPHEKVMNPEATLTYTSVQKSNQIEIGDTRRNAFSQNLSLGGQSNSIGDQIWNKNSNLTQKDDLQH